MPRSKPAQRIEKPASSNCWIDLPTGLTMRVGHAWPSLKGFEDHRLVDLVSPRMMDVLRHVGWRSRPPGRLICAYLRHGDRTVAVGWSQPAVTLAGQVGFNGSYLVASDWEGRGLAGLCAAAAFMFAADLANDNPGGAEHPPKAWVQTRRENARSVALAARQGFVEDPTLSFSCDVSTTGGSKETLDFVGMSQPAEQYLALAVHVFNTRLAPMEAREPRFPFPDSSVGRAPDC